MSENTKKLEVEEHTSLPQYTVEYILSQIADIQKQTAYLSETIAQLAAMGSANVPGDVQGQARARALGDVVRCRETTNQQLLQLYEKMFDKLTEQPDERRWNALSKFADAAANMNEFESDDALSSLEGALDSIRQIFRENK